MICLDTNYLIGALVSGSRASQDILDWLDNGEVLATPAICWYEFLSGPVSEEHVNTVRSVLRGGILPFDEVDATSASHLFNAANRARRLRVDAMIAASTICRKALLATENKDDFAAFVAMGLKLVSR